MPNITARTWALAVLGVVLMFDGVSAEQRRTAPTPLQKVAFKVDSLKKWGTRKFDYYIDRGIERAVKKRDVKRDVKRDGKKSGGKRDVKSDGKKRDVKRVHVGTVTMSTKVGKDTIVLHDVWKLTYRGKKVSLDLTIECEANSLLRTKKVTSVGKGDDEFGTFTLVIKKNKGIATTENGRTKQIDYPSGTLTDMALFRVFTMLPRRKGASFAIGPFMEVSELNLKGPATIRCAGLDEITLHGRPIKLHKFVYERDERVIAEAWVDNEGGLRQARIDERKTLVEVKAPRKPRDH